MRKFVERLSAEGVPLAVASGSSREAIDAVLAGTGLDTLPATVVCSEEVAHGKPAPDIVRTEAARRLGADPADCVVVRTRRRAHRPPTRRTWTAWRSRT